MIGQTFTLIGNPKLVFRLVWRGSIAGIDCVRGVALNGKFQTMRRARRRPLAGRMGSIFAATTDDGDCPTGT